MEKTIAKLYSRLDINNIFSFNKQQNVADFFLFFKYLQLKRVVMQTFPAKYTGDSVLCYSLFFFLTVQETEGVFTRCKQQVKFYGTCNV